VKIKEFPILVCRDDDEEASLPSSGDEMSSLARPVDPKPLHQQVKSRAIHFKPAALAVNRCGVINEAVIH